MKKIIIFSFIFTLFLSGCSDKPPDQKSCRIWLIHRADTIVLLDRYAEAYKRHKKETEYYEKTVAALEKKIYNQSRQLEYMKCLEIKNET